MTSKERLNTALAHKSPDKMAIDFGGTPVSGIHVWAIDKIREHYGLERNPVRVIEPYQMLGEIDDELRDVIGIDTIGLTPRLTMFGFPNEDWKEFDTFWGQKVLVPGNFNTRLDDQGSLLLYPEGDMSVDPCAKMPAAGYFFDAIIRQEPIDDSALNPEDNLEEFGYISETDLEYWEGEFSRVRDSGKSIVANFGGTAFGDIALVPGMNLKHPKGIRDVAEWYMSTLMRRDYIHAVFEKQCEIAISNLQEIYDLAGDIVDVLFICGTDFGTQDSQFCSADDFDGLYAPYYKKVNSWLHENTSCKSFKHSCGAIEPLLDNIIESGFDIINPVQINAVGMDARELKKNYGDRIVFWGGGVDTQKVLSLGSPKDVEKQVLEQCEIFSKNGGFIFNSVHNVQANVPVENLVAMIEAVKKFNGEN
jgi:hypothetical protein